MSQSLLTGRRAAACDTVTAAAAAAAAAAADVWDDCTDFTSFVNASCLVQRRPACTGQARCCNFVGQTTAISDRGDYRCSEF